MLVFILQNKLVFYDRKPRDTVIPVIRQFFLRLSGANFQTDLKGKHCGIIKKNDKRKKLERIWTVEQLGLPKNNGQKEEIMRLIFKLSFLEQKRKWLTLDVKTRLLEEHLLLSFFYLIQISFSVKDEEFMIRSKKKNLNNTCSTHFYVARCDYFYFTRFLHEDNSNQQCQILHSLFMFKPFKHFELKNASPMLHNNEITLLTNPLAAES